MTDQFEYLYKAAASAEPSNNSNYLPDGFIGEVVIDRCEFGTNRHHKPRLFVDFTILTSNKEAYPPGMAANQAIIMDNDMGPGNANAFVGCLYGIGPGKEFLERRKTEITPMIMSQTLGKSQAMAGTILPLTVRVAAKKTSEGDFTHYNWGPASKGKVPGYSRPSFRDRDGAPGTPSVPGAPAGAPALPGTPPPPPAPPAPWAPPAGWQLNPNDPSGVWYWHAASGEQKTRAQLGG